MTDVEVDSRLPAFAGSCFAGHDDGSVTTAPSAHVLRNGSLASEAKRALHLTVTFRTSCRHPRESGDPGPHLGPRFRGDDGSGDDDTYVGRCVGFVYSTSGPWRRVRKCNHKCTWMNTDMVGG